MGVTADTIGVEVVAYNARLRSDLLQSERITDQAARRMDKSISSIGKKPFGAGRAALGGFGLLGTAMAANRIGAGMDALDPVMMTSFATAARALEGDLKGVVRGMQRLRGEVRDMPGMLGEMARGSMYYVDLIRGGFGFASREYDKPGEIARRQSVQGQTREGQGRLLDLQHELNLSKAVHDEQKAILEKEYQIAQAHRDMLLSPLSGTNPELAAQIRDAQIALAGAEFNESMRRKVPNFETFQTVIGAFKSNNRARGISGTDRPAQEDTAKQTANNTKEIVKVLKDTRDQDEAFE